MSDNILGPAIGIPLGLCLAKNTCLQSLYINNTAFNDLNKITEALASRNTTLKHLGVAANRLGDAGALLLAEILLKNHHLNSLDISGNLLTDQSGFAIATALSKRGVPMEFLKLDKNRFEEYQKLRNDLERYVQEVCIERVKPGVFILDGIQEV